MSTIYDFSARGIDGTEQALDQYRGRVLLVVNVASAVSRRSTPAWKRCTRRTTTPA